MDDEWFIVWLLFQLSEYDPELVISVVDNDGQFLLIEAALVLPRWIKPENTKNRVIMFAGGEPKIGRLTIIIQVWIHQGNLHIIPLPRTPAELTQIPQNLEDIGTTIALVLNPKIKVLPSAIPPLLMLLTYEFRRHLQINPFSRPLRLR